MHLEPVFQKHFEMVERKKITMPMVYDIFQNESDLVIANSSFLKDIRQQISKFRRVFVSQMRHCWKNYGEEYSKGNDVLIKAFAELCNNHTDACLVLFEYGVDVPESKQLVTELGISDNIIWVPVMDRKYILTLLKDADLCIGEINHSFLTYGVVLEAFVSKVPLVHNTEQISDQTGYTTMYDCFHASNQQELLEVMNKVYNNDFDKEAMVNTSYDWYFREVVRKFIYHVSNAVNEKVA
jgi:glycosyltransferase involved in cell wall biosynthesis